MTHESKRGGRSVQTGEADTQFQKFKKLAEESGCEDNDAAFDKTLKRLAETPPPETIEKRKTKKARG